MVNVVIFFVFGYPMRSEKIKFSCHIVKESRAKFCFKALNGKGTYF